ncbi:lytic transglycosylase domain-containing protein [Sphingomonas sp. LB3N6]|uniref:lytic transglycosylase domain-containing protein n=1 Tax=Sphingomonas fucosidasi TaxID=3096164 RepID=UPI002FCBFEC4
MLSVIHTESRFNSLAIGVNRGGRSKPKPRSYAEAVNTAYALIRAGYNIDLGLGQINSANLRRLNLSIEDAFDPCRSLTAAATVLTANYLRVLPRSQSTQHALATALSMYNTGREWRGFVVSAAELAALTDQSRHSVILAEERKRVRHHELEIRVEQGIKHPRPGA